MDGKYRDNGPSGETGTTWGVGGIAAATTRGGATVAVEVGTSTAARVGVGVVVGVFVAVAIEMDTSRIGPSL